MPNFCINFLNKAAKLLTILYDFAVASYMDAWIKILAIRAFSPRIRVASYMDAWIKIINRQHIIVLVNVASYMDAWIKIICMGIDMDLIMVASYMDAWIKNGETIHQKYLVASFVDAWIKMMKKYLLSELLFSRTLGVCRSK